MNLLKCDKCANRNIMCFNCENNHYYRKTDWSHDEHILQEAIKDFAEWCYINGIDFSYMAKATDTEPFCTSIIKRFNADRK
jgi:hypothetical protein